MSAGFGVGTGVGDGEGAGAGVGVSNGARMPPREDRARVATTPSSIPSTGAGSRSVNANASPSTSVAVLFWAAGTEVGVRRGDAAEGTADGTVAANDEPEEVAGPGVATGAAA